MNFKKKVILSLKATAILSLLSAILLTISFRWHFNSTEGYFTKGALPVIFSIIYFSVIITSLAAIFVLDKNQIIKTKNEPSKMQVFYIAIAASLAISVLACNLLSDNNLLSTGSLGVCAFLVYVILRSTKSGYNPSPIKILLIYASILFPLFMMFSHKTNYLRHMNSVENTLMAVFAISFMSYILYEAKRVHEGTHSRWHFGTMLLTFHSGLSLSLAYVIAFLTKSVNEPLRFLQIIPMLLISLFVGLELLNFINEAKSHTQEEWNEIEKPEEEIEEALEHPTAEENTIEE